MWKNCCRRDAMFFRSLHNTKRCFSCLGSGWRGGTQATLWEHAVVCHNKAQMYLPGVASTMWEAPCSPVVLTEATGSWKQRELGAHSIAQCASYLVSLWGSSSIWALRALRYKAWLVSLCRCFSDKWVQFPSWLLKSESLREEKQHSKAISSLLSLKRYSSEMERLLHCQALV